jgi:nitrogen fixation NifU-like protein
MPTDAYRQHFETPRGHGRLEDATHRGAHEDAACGDAMELDVRVADGRVEDLRYRVRGCSGAIAAASALATLLPGRAAAADAVTREDLERELGGVPATRRHALGLALRALAVALESPVA